MCYTPIERLELMLIIENDQAICRGEVWNWPTEIWNCAKQEWQPYSGYVPKPLHWGNVITLDEAKGYMEPN